MFAHTHARVRLLSYKGVSTRACAAFTQGRCTIWETLESVSLCTQFSGFSTISSFSFNRLSSKLVGMFPEIVPMFVAKDFTRRHLVAQICASSGANAHFGAYLRDEAIPNKILSYEHWNYLKEHAYQF